RRRRRSSRPPSPAGSVARAARRSVSGATSPGCGGTRPAVDDTTTGTTGALLRGGPPEPESLARFLARPLRVLVTTPVRQFQVLGVLTLAATVWAAFAWIVVPTDPFGPSATDEVVGTLAGLVEGTVEERWVARYFLLALGAAVVA